MPDNLASQAVPYCANTLNAVIRIIEAYQVPVGNSAAGEIAAEMTMAALRQLRDEVRALAGNAPAAQSAPAPADAAQSASQSGPDTPARGAVAALASARCLEVAFWIFVNSRMGYPCYDAGDAVRFILAECCVERLEDLDRDGAARARFERNIERPYLKSRAPSFFCAD